jgi:hypothetical protein
LRAAEVASGAAVGCQSQLSAAAGAPARLRFAKRPNSPGFGSFALEACDSGLHGCGSWGLPVGGAERQSQLHAGALQGTSRSSWEPQSAGCGAVEPPARGAPERPPASAEGAAVPAGALEDGEPAARRRRVKGARVWVPGDRPPRAKPGLEPSSSSKEFQDHEKEAEVAAGQLTPASRDVLVSRQWAAAEVTAGQLVPESRDVLVARQRASAEVKPQAEPGRSEEPLLAYKGHAVAYVGRNLWCLDCFQAPGSAHRSWRTAGAKAPPCRRPWGMLSPDSLGRPRSSRAGPV